MKKFIKSNLKIITAFIIGAAIFGGIGLVSAYNIFASQVSYTPEWKAKDGSDITNIKQALDELYTDSREKTVIQGLTCSSGNGSFADCYIAVPDLTNYKTFKISSLTLDSGQISEFALKQDSVIASFNTSTTEITTDITNITGPATLHLYARNMGTWKGIYAGRVSISMD